ncbi:hypothetical protein OIU78_006133 [Salix suchowensis]|nr:hypothetical protein OIU78_006133 [Salix suchowensis]
MTPLENNKTTKSYEDRKNTLKKKARELAILCDVPVCIICVDPDGTPETWPEEKERVVEVLKAYKASPTVNNVEGEATVVDQVVGKEQTGKKRKIMHDKIKSKTVGDVNTMEAGLITRNFLDVVGLNHQTNSYTGNHSDISSFLGKNFREQQQRFPYSSGLGVKVCDEINATSGKYRNLAQRSWWLQLMFR